MARKPDGADGSTATFPVPLVPAKGNSCKSYSRNTRKIVIQTGKLTVTHPTPMGRTGGKDTSPLERTPHTYTVICPRDCNEFSKAGGTTSISGTLLGTFGDALWNGSQG